MTLRMIACLLAMLVARPAIAGEPDRSLPQESAASATPQNESAIRRAIRQLNSDTIAERQAAAEQLRQAGAAAIEPLTNSCRDGAGERVAQSINILQSFAGSEDRDLRSAATQALQKIAAGENVTAAQLAASALTATRMTIARRNTPRPLVDQMGEFDRFVEPLPGQRTNFSMSTVRQNGRELIKIQDGERRINIEKQPNGSIRIEWREGDKPPQIAQADDIESLRTKHPDAAAIYDQYQTDLAAAPGMLGPGFIDPLLDPMRLEGLQFPRPMRPRDDHWARMRAEHQQKFEEMRADHQRRMQEMRQLAPLRPTLPPAQLRRLREETEQLRQRVEKGEVDEATLKEISRLQSLLDALQRQVQP
ncbi:MAG: hypothetical protein ACIALR_14600 [Blastopirellula sp. JB062]